MHIHSFKARKKKRLNNKYLLSNKMPGSWFFFSEQNLFENYSRSEIATFQAKKNN